MKFYPGRGRDPGSDLGDLAAAQAAGTDLDGFMGFTHHGSHLHQVGLPGSPGFVVGMADIVARRG